MLDDGEHPFSARHWLGALVLLSPLPVFDRHRVDDEGHWVSDDGCLVSQNVINRPGKHHVRDPNHVPQVIHSAGQPG